MAIRKISLVSRLSSNITSPTPRNRPWPRFTMVRPPVPVATSQLGLDGGLGFGREWGDQRGRLEEVELVDGEQQ